MRNKIFSIIVFTAFLCLGNVLKSQNNMVSNAIQAFHEGDYRKAYELSGDALANMDALSGDYIPAAYYYLARSRVQVLRLAMESGDRETLARMQNALIESYYDYKEALKTSDQKLRSDIEFDLAGLFNPILQTGLAALNTGNDPSQPENVRQAATKAALGYLRAAKDISPSYLACDLLGQAELQYGDSASAYANFSESITAYKNQPPEEPDFLMAYVFYRKAIIERYGQDNASLAITTLSGGEQLLRKEYGRMKMKGGIDSKAQQEFDKGLYDIVSFEMDIYLNAPELRQQALVRMPELLSIYPVDYALHLAYASMLEEVDPLMAIEAYKTAINIDDSQELAYFNLGAVYNNLGSEYYIDGLNHDNDHAADSLYNEANRCFRSAYKYMEEAHRLNPDNLETIRALKQLAGTLGLEEQAEEYKQKEIRIRGF
jgi:tetratricopeptide (TPR) repeat protein